MGITLVPTNKLSFNEVHYPKKETPCSCCLFNLIFWKLRSNFLGSGVIFFLVSVVQDRSISTNGKNLSDEKARSFFFGWMYICMPSEWDMNIWKWLLSLKYRRACVTRKDCTCAAKIVICRKELQNSISFNIAEISDSNLASGVKFRPCTFQFSHEKVVFGLLWESTQATENWQKTTFAFDKWLSNQYGVLGLILETNCVVTQIWKIQKRKKMHRRQDIRKAKNPRSVMRKYLGNWK